jgi:hypothetical protein
MLFPKFLIDTDINETAKLVYVVLLDRTRLSLTKDGYTDKLGHVYIYYPIDDIAKAVHKSRTTIKSALSILEGRKLILRVHQGIGQASRIYVKIPFYAEAGNSSRQGQKFDCSKVENQSCGGKKTVFTKDEKLTGSKKDINKNETAKINEQMRRTYGSYKNVFLTDDEYKNLYNEFSQCDEYIERLSVYMASKGKTYSNHAATIRKWILQDTPQKAHRNYDCREDESL